MGFSPMHHYFTSALLAGLLSASSNIVFADDLIPHDIAYTITAESTAPETNLSLASAKIAALPISENNQQSTLQDQSRSDKGCPSQNKLQKSIAVTTFLRTDPHTANPGSLFAIEQGFPQWIKNTLDTAHQLIGPELLPQGFSAKSLNETQLKQQAQRVASHHRTQFILTGSVFDMDMQQVSATYNPSLGRQTANIFYDVTGIQHGDKRRRNLGVEVSLRDGFTGEQLFTRRYNMTAVWNNRSPMGFNSPAFKRTPYGKQAYQLAHRVSADIANVIHCQPFMAQIDNRPGHTQVLLYGGANNGLHAGDSMQLYQLVVQPSNSEYQVANTRIVKRDTNLYLSEVYPSHSIATIKSGSYLSGHYLAVSE